jgi:hypothetical protein
VHGQQAALEEELVLLFDRDGEPINDGPVYIERGGGGRGQYEIMCTRWSVQGKRTRRKGLRVDITVDRHRTE